MTLEILDQNELSPEPPAKRTKLESPPDVEISPAPIEGVDSGGLDQILPAVEESEAVRKYENRRRRSSTGTYKSSIYVDAFNLALDTVLKDESYLFSGDEAGVFAIYRSLSYEAQHLYVRLFLRKTAAWFCINKLQYQNDIADMNAACAVLQSVALADTDKLITLEDAAGLLQLAELKALAKHAKCAGANKSQLIAGLKRVSRAQGGLQVRGGQLKLSFDVRGNYVDREEHFVRKILEKTGPCIRLSSAMTALFNRVHLVFYRSTEWTERSLTTVILSRTMRRNFPHYIVSRTSNIFPTRQALLDFEASIKLQSEIDEILGAPTDEGLHKIHDILEETYPLWETLVRQESEAANTATHDELQERVYLRRFNATWVYTRIIHKGVYVLGRFKRYKREHEILTALLSQKFFQPARRGGWYQRKALIEENYSTELDPGSNFPKEALTKKWRQVALSTCEAGLQDPQTRLIFHHDLQKRILKLEHRLRVPKRDQHDFGYVHLRAPTSRTMSGERLSAPELGRKTLWRNPKGTSECSVEEMCLSNYRADGWKGYHSEGGIVKTLFAYLFYDILFLYLPNVFETAFQTAPLDLFTDAFYSARASEINHRLVELANGDALRILRAVWDANHERATCVVGLDWSYGIEELEEIVQCFPPNALSIVCKVLCQEYRQRGSGIPDLFLWRFDEKRGVRECMFSEVKSENDRLSDTQRLWIHVLSSAGVRVELCAAKGTKEIKGGARKK